MGSRQVVKGIYPEKMFGPSNVRKNFFNPLNGTLTEIFLATGGGRSPK